LQGIHQLDNASTAIASAIILKNYGFNIDINTLGKSIYSTKWPGRLEIIKYKKKIIILDGSHNISGAEQLNSFLKNKKIKPDVIFGMLKNKKIYHFLKSIKNNINVLFPIKIPEEKNALSQKEIEKYTEKLNIKYSTKKNLDAINKDLIRLSNKYILITGSLYLVGKLRKKYL